MKLVRAQVRAGCPVWSKLHVGVSGVLPETLIVEVTDPGCKKINCAWNGENINKMDGWFDGLNDYISFVGLVMIQLDT